MRRWLLGLLPIIATVPALSGCILVPMDVPVLVVEVNVQEQKPPWFYPGALAACGFRSPSYLVDWDAGRVMYRDGWDPEDIVNATALVYTGGRLTSIGTDRVGAVWWNASRFQFAQAVGVVGDAFLIDERVLIEGDSMVFRIDERLPPGRDPHTDRIWPAYGYTGTITLTHAGSWSRADFRALPPDEFPW